MAARASSHGGEQGLSLVVMCGLLFAAVSLVAAQTAGCVGFNSCGLQARLLRGTETFPDQGLNPYPLH